MVRTEESAQSPNVASSPFSAQFASEFLGATVILVNPQDCFPLIKGRHICRSGVELLKSIFDAKCSKIHGKHIGFVSTSDNSIVVKITDSYRPLLISYLMSAEKLTRSDAESLARSKSTWYGIIDGRHTHVALLELRRDRPDRWANFKWPVLQLTSSPPIEVLSRIARVSNAKHSELYHVEQTLYDILLGVLQEKRRLEVDHNKTSEKKKKISIAAVACAYDGVQSSKHTSSMTYVSSAVVTKLEDSIIHSLGEIMNKDHPELCIQGQSSLGVDEVMGELDCRVYRNLISLNGLYTAKSFLNCVGTESTDHQINALHRISHLYWQAEMKRGYSRSKANGISGAVLDKQLSLAILAMNEVRKFNKFLENHEWPKQLETERNNLLRTTKLDEEVEKNSGNEDILLPSLLSAYKMYYGSTYHIKLSKYQLYLDLKNQSNDKECPQDSSSTKDSAPVELPIDFPSGVPNSTNEYQELSNDNHTKESQVVSEEDIRQKKLQDLRFGGIHLFNMSWELYYTSEHRTEDMKIDLLITDPGCVQQNATVANTIVQAFFDQDNRRKFVKFCLDILLPGGYVMIFTTVKDFSNWYDIFREYKFNCLPYPLGIPQDDGIQHRKCFYFPQNNMDLAFMARAPGEHPLGFRPDFNGDYENIAGKRRFGCPGFTKRSTPRLNKIHSRSPVRSDERNYLTLKDYIVQFTPSEGTVMDPLAGTNTTGLGSILAGRNVILIEKDRNCFDQSLERLCQFKKHYSSTSTSEEPPPKRTRLQVRLKENSISQQVAPEIPHNECSTPTTNKFLGSSSNEFSSSSSDIDISTTGILEKVTPQSGKSVTKRITNSSDSDIDPIINLENSFNSSEDSFQNEIFSPDESQNDSIPSSTCPEIIETESTVQQSVNNYKFQPGSEVVLIQNDQEVGEARLQDPLSTENSNYRRSIHNNCLQQFDSEGVYYVSILRMNIYENYHNWKYIYPTFGNDDPPEILSDCYTSGVYVWDLNNMKHKEVN